MYFSIVDCDNAVKIIAVSFAAHCFFVISVSTVIKAKYKNCLYIKMSFEIKKYLYF